MDAWDRAVSFAGRYQDEILLFTVFLSLMTLSAHIYGWNEYSRMDLSRAIASDGSFAITPYHNNTGDKIRYGGEYYTDKPPMASFVGVPAYLLSAPFTPDPGGYVQRGTDFAGEPTVVPRTPPTLFHILFVMLTAAVPAALLVVLIKRRTAADHGRRTGLLVALCFGAGTLLLTYGSIAMGVTLAALFAYLSYLYTTRDPTVRNRVLAGVFGGLAVATEYYAAFIPIAIFLFLVHRERRSALWYAAGGLLGLLPLAAYNLSISGIEPLFLQTSSFYQVPSLVEQIHGTTPDRFSLFRTYAYSLYPDVPAATVTAWIGINMAVTALKLLVYPVRGLLFYSPLLLVAFAGMWLGRAGGRRDRAAVLPLACFAAVFLFNVSIMGWAAGVSYGPRYLVIAVPLLAAPFAEAVSTARWRRTALALLPFSIIQAVAGLRGPIHVHGDAFARQVGKARGHVFQVTADWTAAPAVIADMLRPHSLGNYLAHLAGLVHEGPPVLAVTSLAGEGPWTIRIGAASTVPDLPVRIAGIPVSLPLGWVAFGAAAMLAVVALIRGIPGIRASLSAADELG